METKKEVGCRRFGIRNMTYQTYLLFRKLEAADIQLQLQAVQVECEGGL